MLWVLILIIGATAIVMYRRKRHGILKLHDEMPFGITSYPVVGHGHLFRGTDADRMNTLTRIARVALQQNGYTSFWMGRKLYVDALSRLPQGSTAGRFSVKRREDIIYLHFIEDNFPLSFKDVKTETSKDPLLSKAIADPEAMEIVAKTCLEKDETTMKYIRGVLGNGLIFAPVKIWRPRRKVMAPTFNMKNLQEFVSIFDKQSTIMMHLLRKHSGQGDFSLWQYITTYTFDSICETVLGVDLNAQKTQNHPFIDAFDEVVQILAQRMLSPWLYWDWVFWLTPLYKRFVKNTQMMYDFFDEVLRVKRKQLSNRTTNNDSSDCKKTFLDMMLDDNGGFRGYSDIELREEVLSIVSAGTDTSAVGTAFTAIMLSRYPRVQEKVYQELKEVFGDSDRPVTWKDLPKLKYLEVVIKETLRLYPPAPVVVRDVHETVLLPNGSTLVPGIALMLHLWGTHRNVKYWGEDAEEFRPERFLEGPFKHPAMFIPFSYSLRNCIGSNYAMLSAKTNLANLLRRYVVMPPASLPEDQLTKPLRIKFDIMMKHCDHFEVRLECRKAVVG